MSQKVRTERLAEIIRFLTTGPELAGIPLKDAQARIVRRFPDLELNEFLRALLISVSGLRHMLAHEYLEAKEIEPTFEPDVLRRRKARATAQLELKFPKRGKRGKR
jgi:hypothetical protein